jgi:hypothetical protein
VFGTASVVKNLRQKVSALRVISEHILPGRGTDVRKPNKIELRQTLVLCLPLREASAKARRDPPVDEKADYSLSVWAGELPVRLATGAPISDPRLPQHLKASAYVRNY